MKSAQIANLKLKLQKPDWRSLTQYSLLYYGQTQNLETLQNFVNLIYDIDIKEDDYNSKKDFAKARLIQIMQLSLLYFEHCKLQLDNSFKQMEDHKQQIDKKINQKEQFLRQQKLSLHEKTQELHLEQRALEKFIEKTNNMRLYKCYLCDQKLFETEEHWKSHMSRRHQEELKEKELKQMFQMMSNLLLQQRMNNLIQTNLEKKFVKEQFTLLEQKKRETIDRWREEKIMEAAIQQKLEENQKHYDLQAQKILEQHQQKVQQLKDQNQKVFSQSERKINDVQLDFLKRIEKKDEQTQQILKQDFTEIQYNDEELKQVQNYESQKLMRTSLRKFSYREIKSLNKISSKINLDQEKEKEKEKEKEYQEVSYELFN